ncbi:MAG: carboxypeptidase-like regulatory domain-containing protein [Chloroflexota bacterium]
MNCTVAIKQTITFLFTKQHRDDTLPSEVVDHIVTCSICLSQLENITDTVTELPASVRELLSRLQAENETIEMRKIDANKVGTAVTNRGTTTHQGLDFEELEQLSAYVDDQMAGQDLATRNPAMNQRLERDLDFREQYNSLAQTMKEDATDLLGGSHGDSLADSSIGSSTNSPEREPIWQRFQEHAYSLTSEISIQVSQTAAIFDGLSTMLTSQLTPLSSGAMRNKRPDSVDNQPLNELLELPHPEANMSIHVSMGPIVKSRGALVIQTQTLSPSQPIEHAAISLYDEEDGLLERMSSNADGLVAFDSLELGKYTVQVNHADNQWRFVITLKEVD